MVHRRELNGTELVLGNQGALYQGAMTWWDHDTGSVWSQPLGEAIMGPRTGERLELLSSTLTSWEAWRASHPDTLALDVSSGGSRFSLDQMAIVVELDADAVAYPVPQLRDAGGVVNDTVGGVAVAVVVDRDQRWAVFARELGGRVLTLEFDGGVLVDRETGTRWDPVRGIPLDGPLASEVESLGRLPGFTSFIPDFERFWPDGEVWDG